eukprot:PITA_13222
MGSHQSGTNTSGGGLPVCLSGIGIHRSSLQSSSRLRHHHHHRNEVMRLKTTPTRDSSMVSSVISREENLDQRLATMTLNEVPVRRDILQERPRHALALQMADLDRRREAIKNLRSNRGITNFVDEQITLVQRYSHRMQSVIRSRMQDPSFEHEFVRGHNSCANAG